MRTEKGYPKIILTKQKIVFDTVCPKCGKGDAAAMPNIDLKCSNCHTKYTKEAKVNIYFSVSKMIEQKLGDYNGVYILGVRDNNKSVNSHDALKPKSRFEDEIYHALLAIRDVKIKQKCWEVSEITSEVDTDYQISCNQCGYCYTCVQCVCGKHYIPKSLKRDGLLFQHYKCPSCGSKKYKQTTVPAFIQKNGKHVCPYCESEHIAKTKFAAEKKKCPRCGTNDITKARDIPVYQLLIERQKRFFD